MTLDVETDEVAIQYAGGTLDFDVVAAMTPEGLGAPTVLTDLFGGQGTINVPSWSPDSRELAYVRYT